QERGRQSRLGAGVSHGVVGAINVLERGQRLLACGEGGSGRSRKTAVQPASVKQEPAEATMQEATHA
ncbi:MAG: hypothetical protein RSC66_07945, partial [Comamonas sp.]